MMPKLTQVDCSRGAPMGRVCTWPPDRTVPVKLHVEELQWVDGDYDGGGAYWGNPGGTHIYRACSEEKFETVYEPYAPYHDEPHPTGRTEPVEIFVRAPSREVAKTQILELLPRAEFF